MKRLHKISIAVLFAACCLQTGSAFAALNLSVISVDGSSALRLGRVASGIDNKQQMRVRITATDGVQYQVFQRVMEPIVNEKGEQLNLQAIETATMPNSNASGTLYLQNAERLGMGEQLVYTSGQGGPSDEFQIAYSVRPELLNVNGNLLGKIVFMVRPIGAGSPQQVMVNVSLESVSQWNVTVNGGRTFGRVSVKDSDTTPANADFVRITFSGNPGQEVRIYQEIESPLQNQMADEIGADVLKFGLEGNSPDSIRVSGLSSIARTRTLIYAGSKAEDTLAVYFMVDPSQAERQDAGRYAGKIRYVVERDNGSETFSIDLDCQIQPFFVMDLSFPPEGVRFSNILATEPPVDKEVTVTVRSNLHKDYQVAQSLASLMVNEKGEEINKEFMTFKVEIPQGQSGRTKYTDFSPMETGEYPVFSSDGDGSPAVFKVIYRLKGYPDMPSGQFNAPIRFSLNQN